MQKYGQSGGCILLSFFLPNYSCPGSTMILQICGNDTKSRLWLGGSFAACRKVLQVLKEQFKLKNKKVSSPLYLTSFFCFVFLCALISCCIDQFAAWSWACCSHFQILGLSGLTLWLAADLLLCLNPLQMQYPEFNVFPANTIQLYASSPYIQHSFSLYGEFPGWYRNTSSLLCAPAYLFLKVVNSSVHL